MNKMLYFMILISNMVLSMDDFSCTCIQDRKELDMQERRSKFGFIPGLTRHIFKNVFDVEDRWCKLANKEVKEAKKNALKARHYDYDSFEELKKDSNFCNYQDLFQGVQEFKSGALEDMLCEASEKDQQKLQTLYNIFTESHSKKEVTQPHILYSPLYVLNNPSYGTTSTSILLPKNPKNCVHVDFCILHELSHYMHGDVKKNPYFSALKEMPPNTEELLREINSSKKGPFNNRFINFVWNIFKGKSLDRRLAELNKDHMQKCDEAIEQYSKAVEKRCDIEAATVGLEYAKQGVDFFSNKEDHEDHEHPLNSERRTYLTQLHRDMLAKKTVENVLFGNSKN